MQGDLHCLEHIAGLYFISVLLPLDLPSSISATRRTRHQLNVLEVAFLSLELSYYVLDVLEPISHHELKRHASVGNLLVVPVLSLGVDQFLSWVDLKIEKVFGCSSEHIFQVAV
jgi:hypothetical protein